MTPKELREARAKFDETQAQFAARLDLSREYISRLENGSLAVPRVVELAVQALLAKYGYKSPP